MPATPTIWTVGHSNREFDCFMELLLPERIEFLIDVRSYPYSRYASQFNTEQLQANVGAWGVRYVFMGEQLGGRPASDDQYDADGHALYGPMAELEPFRDAVERLIAGASSHRLALMCSCGQPTDCHRRLLVGRILTDRGVQLRHVLPDGTVHIEDAVVLSEDGPQCSLLGEEEPWRSTRSVSHRRRLRTSSAA